MAAISHDLLRSVSIAGASDVPRAATALISIVRSLGAFKPIISHNIASRQPMIDERGRILGSTIFGSGTTDFPWWNDGQLALRSPLARACRYESNPFWADRSGIRTATPNPYLDAIRLNDFERRSLTKAAIVVPVHLAFGQIGMAAYTSPDAGAVSREGFDAYADTLMIISHLFIASYVKVFRRILPNFEGKHLSQREVECVNWAALGKTDAEISSIMQCSHSTVRFHWNNLAAKLGTRGRTPALFRAMQLGYVSAY